MNTWKLSIKPDSKEGFNPFTKCKEKSLLGLGWHHAYVETHPTDLEHAKSLVKDKWGKWPYQLKYLLEDMEIDDHVWIHQEGKYYLCKVENNMIIYGRDIDPEYQNFDLGHARKAIWVEIPEKFVTGAVQRGTIAQRTIQQIKITKKEVAFNEVIFRKLQIDPAWEPIVDERAVALALANVSPNELFSIMSPDDVEDVVSAYLQSKGWILVKSTCFRSKPKFEFSMLNNKNEIGHVQVKSGKYPDPLSPSKYKSYIGNRILVFLFSTNNNPYPGEAIPNVHTIDHIEIYDWVIKNLWSLTMPLKYRLWVFLKGENC